MAEPQDTVPIASQFISSFLSPKLEKCPWVNENIYHDKSVPNFDEDNFDENKNGLKAAWKYISQYTNNVEESNITINDEQFPSDDETDIIYMDDAESADIDKIDETRLRYMKEKHDTITNYPPNFDDIKDEKFKKLIKDNADTLFHLEYYQEQIYFILQFTDGKKQRAVASFFNVCPGTIYQHNLRRLSDKKMLELLHV